MYHSEWFYAVRQMLMAQGVQGEQMEIILNSRREGSKKQYTTHIRPSGLNTVIRTLWIKLIKL